MKKRIGCRRSIYLLAVIFLFGVMTACQGRMVAASQQMEELQEVKNADTKEEAEGTKDAIFDGRANGNTNETANKDILNQDTLIENTTDKNISKENALNENTSKENISREEESKKNALMGSPAEDYTSGESTLNKGTPDKNSSNNDTSDKDIPDKNISNKNTSDNDNPEENTSEETFTQGDTSNESKFEEISQTPSPEISPSKKADFHLSMRADTTQIKAGAMIAYEIVLENTGDYPLQNLNLSSTFSENDLEIVWEEAVGLKIDELAGSAVLDSLGEGEIRTFYLTIPTREEQESPIVHTLMVSADNPEENMVNSEEFVSAAAESRLIREVTLTTAVLPLKVEFSVSKTADRAMALPGDTITYQICIRNTGERTLHSVLTTERFQAENISAQFVQKDGVLLNGSKTQALISKIAPGEAFGLQATVKVPNDFTGQELLNEVIVTTDETGEQKMTAQANVKLVPLLPTNTQTPTGLVDAEGVFSEDSLASAASTHPKTGDTAVPALWACLLTFSFLVCSVIFWKRKAKSKH